MNKELLAQIENKIKNSPTVGLDKKLITSLRKTNENLALSPQRQYYLNKLDDSECLYLITGQQVGLFGGPCLTFYKVITLIEVAKELKTLTKREVIPIFWLQTEDHDFSEINHTHLVTTEGSIIKIADKDFADKSPVSNKFIANNIEELKKEFRSNILNIKEDSFQILDQSYQTGKSYAQAFKEFLAQVFAEEGLLFFDPREKYLAELYLPVFITALEKHKLIEEDLNQAKNKGFNQVNILPNSPLFFYHLEQEGNKNRFRLEESSGSFKLRGLEISFTKEALIKEIKNNPQDFSTSALLRPILQNSLFPCVGYIGGNAELSYFNQVNSFVKNFGLENILCIPRLKASILEASTRRQLEKLSLTVENIFPLSENLFEQLHWKLLPNANESEKLEEEIKADLSKIELKALEQMAKGDANFMANIKRANEKVTGIYAALFSRYKDKLKESSSGIETKINKLKNNFLPLNQPQERVFPFAYFWCKYGSEFKTTLKNNFELLNDSEKIINL